jgi:spore coat protein H
LAAALFVAPLTDAASNGVVINEIMYHPPSGLEKLQYIELLNAGESEADLSGWSFSKGLKFLFPPETKLAPGAFLVVCRDRAGFVERYGSHVRLAGQFDGHLSHDGERVELADASKKIIDAVDYAGGTPWPTAADGHSSSLELICPFTTERDALNWAASELPEVPSAAGTPGRTNDSFSPHPLPVIRELTLAPSSPAPGQQVIVNAFVSDPNGVKSVTLLLRVAAPGSLSDETLLSMKRISGDERSGRYETTLPAQPEARLVRYRVQAITTTGAQRISPSPNELRTAWSYSTFVNTKPGKLPSAFVVHPGAKGTRSNNYGFAPPQPRPTRGQDAFIYLPAGGGEAQTFDFVHAPPRKGGFKVHFLKEQTLRGMTSINLIFEQSPRWILAEPLAYEVYRLAGVPAELTEHVRFWVDGEAHGPHLLVEQPNKSFLARHHRDDTGNLYKLIWYGSDVVTKHEKKTNLTGGHEDLLEVIKGLNNSAGDEQWAFIQKHFNVEEFINYFAVNMCIQNWDGFHNNYFAYHDTGGTRRWEIYPWDEDKTWGDYDGASGKYDWYELPLTYGMNGAEPPAHLRAQGAGAGAFVAWWREPGFFSGPLLANPQFRQRFLARLREICTTIFTKEKLFPIIDAMEKRLETEVSLSANSHGRDAPLALAEFRADMQSFRNQVLNRRKFIVAELDKRKP